jgi:hypothetical protein
MRGRDAGSTVDAMSDAIEGADVMLYGVSLKYKESANVRIAHIRSSACVERTAQQWCLRLTLCSCSFALAAAQCRMEANYAHQQELDMIPMMVEKDYSPKCVSPLCVLIEALLTCCLTVCFMMTHCV